jgi:hypothetical protein
MRVPTMYLLSTGGSKAITLKLGCSAFAEIRSDFQLPSAHLEGTSPHLTSRYSNTSVSPSLSRLLVRLCVCIMRLVHYVSFMSPTSSRPRLRLDVDPRSELELELRPLQVPAASRLRLEPGLPTAWHTTGLHWDPRASHPRPLDRSLHLDPPSCRCSCRTPATREHFDQ